MRRARSQDHWRRLCDVQKQRQIKLSSLEFTDVVGLGRGTIQLHHALTVLCGANGAGKSTTLTAIGLPLDLVATSERTQIRHALCHLNVRLTTAPDHSEVKKFTFDRGLLIGSECKKFEVHRIDPGAEWFRIRDLVVSESNWNELLDQHGPRDLRREELAELSYLTGKDYSKVTLYEIDEYSGSDVPIPYCLVCIGEQEYRFEEMGAGEGALFLVWWSLMQIRQPAILLLEQPETHVTSRSQLALMDILAAKCEKQVCCIVTTHSTEIISYVPKECLRLLVRNQADVEVVGSPDDGLLRMVLGVEVSRKAIVLTEDRCARIVTREIVRRFRPDLSSQIHVTDSGSESGVLAVLEHFPKDTPGAVIVGLLDGDQRSTFKTYDEAGFSIPLGKRHPVEFLPGNKAPEVLLRDYATNNVDALAATLQIERGRVLTVLTSIEGRDHHDWLEEFSKRIDVTFEHAISILISTMLTDETIRDSFEYLANRLAEHADRACPG